MHGFTLLEIVVAIVLLGILTTVAVFTFDGSKSRGQLLVAGMESYGQALLRMKTDTACYPSVLAALFNQGAADRSFCGVDLRRQWNGPYAQDARVDENGNVLLDQIAPNVALGIRSVAGGAGTQWYISAANVPAEIATQALIACNGADSGAARCLSAAGGGQMATFSLKFAETR